jgi:mannose-6-phosphate isomerase-like protein (cupin superfamily)
MTQTLPKPSAYALTPDQGRSISILGGRVRLLAESSSTAGALSVLETTLPASYPGSGLHTHATYAEAFYVLEGCITYQLEGHTVRAEAGAFSFVPPGAIQMFSNDTDAPTRMLEIILPGGFEHYFDDLAILRAREPGALSHSAALAAIFERNDVQPVNIGLEKGH